MSYLFYLCLNLVRLNLEPLFQTSIRHFERASSVVSSGLLVSQKKPGLGWDPSYEPYRNKLIENRNTIWIQINFLFFRYLRVLSDSIFLNLCFLPNEAFAVGAQGALIGNAATVESALTAIKLRALLSSMVCQSRSCNRPITIIEPSQV
jgi:hypothetical protein